MLFMGPTVMSWLGWDRKMNEDVLPFFSPVCPHPPPFFLLPELVRQDQKKKKEEYSLSDPEDRSEANVQAFFCIFLF